MTVVMVTHDLSEAFGLGTRMLVLDRPATAEGASGARITYDLPLGRERLKSNSNGASIPSHDYQYA